MRVEVARDLAKEDLVREFGELETRHGSFDVLRQRVFVERCADPRAVDDYVVWKAMRDEGGAFEERTVFDTPEVFHALTPRRMEMLEYLRHGEVASIKDLATKLRRDYKNTYDDLAALEAWGLVSVRREGKNQHPVSHVTSLRVSWEK
jgi:DNA-binding transcriptional ArsR family regulator